MLTGASGFIGRHVAQMLASQGIDLVTLGRRRTEIDCDHVSLDLLADYNVQDAIVGHHCTHLIHLAWYAEHGRFWESPLNADWAVATIRLIKAFCGGGAEHIFVAGTCAEYDWRYEHCIEELTPCNPRTFYGVAKDATRRMCQAIASQARIPLAWGRIFFPFGLGENPNRLIPSLFRAFRGELEPFGVNRHFVRDLINVDDLAAAICLCARTKADGIFNLCSGQPASLEQIVRIIASIQGKDPGLILDKAAPLRNEPEILTGKVSQLRALGWHPQKDLSTALAQYQFGNK
jgi:nucleoside-diphosphate-sugar epimerase